LIDLTELIEFNRNIHKKLKTLIISLLYNRMIIFSTKCCELLMLGATANSLTNWCSFKICLLHWNCL